MATTTPNFGWPVPTSTDLVKDGATAIEALGDSIDASLLDLKGGTTGQVLAKNTNTDMDFVWIANDQGDITAVTAGTGLTGGGTSGAVSLAFDVANFGGAQGAGGKNSVINGACEIAQRGTSAVTLTAASFLYPVDRFFVGRSSGTTGATAQQFTSTTLDGFQYGVRVQRTAANTATNDLYIGQSFETANSIPLANKAVVVSFYARAGANYSPTSSALNVRFYTGTGTDQSGLGSAFTGSATPISQTATLTTSWQRFQYTATLSSTTTQMQFLAFCTPTGTAGAADNFDITGLQVELGATATPFARNGGSIQGELSACQRYYYRRSANATNTYAVLSDWGVGLGSANAAVPVFSPVTMRVSPTAVDYGGNLRLHDGTNASSGAVTFTITTIYNNPNNTYLNCSTGSGVTQYRPTQVQASNDATAYLGLSAEL
jgi:hypothetical protein